MKKHNLIIIILLTFFLLQGILSIQQKSITSDEIAHITAGYSYLKTFDFRINPEHPPMIKMISAIPLLFVNPNLPTNIESWDLMKNDVWEEWHYSPMFFYKYNNNADQILFWSRIPMILIGLLMGIYVYRFAKQLYGTKPGLFALLLFSFSPNIIAHSRLVTTDIGFSCFLLISTFYLYRYIKQDKEITNKNLILAAIFFGFCQATKFSALYFIPFPFLVFLLYNYKTLSTEKNNKKIN